MHGKNLTLEELGFTEIEHLASVRAYERCVDTSAITLLFKRRDNGVIVERWQDDGVGRGRGGIPESEIRACIKVLDELRDVVESVN